MITLPEIKHSLDLTEDQTMIRDMVRDFAVREVAPLAHDVDEHHRFDQGIWK
ncbi:MAG TPA: acyl-CoA dehydrogenase family protein, partial [Planctomycetota bacterium]|nr:acyl-CoA dehydrogenase family protein [Planctomycetota bacterium]